MKNYTNVSVWDATISRLDFIFKEFDNVYLSFSGGKDSGVLINIVLDFMTKNYPERKLHVLYIDFEAQYKHTIDFVQRIMLNPKIIPYWVCLPFHLRNSVSQYQPHWLCWDTDKKEAWVRDYPENCIKDETYFPFFRKGMEFEEFVPLFGEWFSKKHGGEKTACLVGIRSDESLNRYRTIKSNQKQTYQDLQYSTKIQGVNQDVFNFYPIYDWKTKDIWVANGKNKYDYNKVYDLMYLAGLSLAQMRLCQPYGDDQRKGLYLFKTLEPETWNKIVNRVEGANFGANYVIGKNGSILGNRKIHKPDGHTWKSYTKFLLKTMPPPIESHYRGKILTFFKWYRKNGAKHGIFSIPDDDTRKFKDGKYYPSWKRVCKTLIKNDYWCKGLGFSQTTKQMQNHMELIEKYTKIL